MNTTKDISPEYRSRWQVPALETPLWLGKQQPYCVVIPVINEGERIKSLLQRMEAERISSIADIIIVDGGSTDGSLELDSLRQVGVRGLVVKKGPGKLSAQLRCAYAFALDQGYEGIVTIDGNDKDDPEAIPRFIEALEGGIDFVQASRFLPGGVAVNTPKSRDFAIRYIHAPCLSIASGFKWTDTTQGFRAYSRRMLLDPKIAPFRDVFSTYELLAYLSYRAPRLGYVCAELPTGRRYPIGEIPTKITSIGGNFNVLIILLAACLSFFNPRNKPNERSAMNNTEKIKAFWLLAFCGLILWVAFYPGFMSNDSIVQFGMSKSLNFNDWHPPIMAWVWSVVGFFFPGPSGMLAVHLALMLISVYLWWDSYKDKPLSWLIFLIPFLPWIINFAGVLWKDVGLAFSLFALSGLALRAITPGKALIAFILIFYSINLRHNAVFAVLPILILLGFRWVKGANSMKVVIFSCATIYVCFFLGGIFNYGILQAERTKPSNYMMVDDLAFLSIVKNESLIPGVGIEEIKQCASSEIGQNKLVGKVFCLSALPGYKQAASLGTDLKGVWLSSIFENPIDYLRFRIAAFSYLLRTPDDRPYYIWHPGIDENSFGLKQVPNGITLLADRFVHKAAKAASFLFKPYWWLMSSLVLLMMTFVVAKTKSVITARALLVSAVFYISGYIPVTPMADFRYIYWSIIATTISFIVIVIDWPGFRSDLSRRVILSISVLGVLFSLLIYNHGRFFGVNVDQVLSDSLVGQRVIVGDPVFKNDLTEVKGAYEVKGGDPFFIYDVSSLGLSSKDVRWLEFVFLCIENRNSPTLQFFWWGDQQEGAVEMQSATRELNEGVNLMSLSNPFAPVELYRIRGIRFDLSNSSACKAINFEKIVFIR